ncbi:biofilm development regulator YmgB/AriR family protein [Pantoea sp. SM3]|uniref:biofilm development regulator YmgB/AriR family protein n=1 Tax=Pantoea sp. SM3 TaxID=1628192 RepID=UPI0005F83144|nr:biofilm development regulator YmgB/AriR family protein [Pantoea sp. SM3]KJV33103.1 two-component-system connector protein AriR [Pantoea sp. SM3]
MQMPEDNFSPISDRELAEHFRNAGANQKEEAAVPELVIHSLMATEGRVSNKAIILSLLGALESAHDAHQANILRRTLEVVVGYTLDDG